jgi:hypothetical protein
MNEQRLQAYYQLIESLLNCTDGEEPEILAANQELLDAGFVQTEVQVIQRYFNTSNVLKKTAATLTAINNSDLNTYHLLLE